MITDVNSQLKYKILSHDEISRVLYRETNHELRQNSTFSHNQMSYEYRSWLRENGVTPSDYEADNGLSPLQYDRAVVIDLHNGNGWNSIFADTEGNGFASLLVRVTELWDTLIDNEYENTASRRVRSHHAQLLWQEWMDEFEYDNNYTLSRTQIQDRGYGSNETHPIASALNRTFRVKAHEYPNGITLGLDDVDFLKHKLFMQTKAPKYWSQIPFRYFVIPMPSEKFTEYLDTNAQPVTCNQDSYLWGNENAMFMQTANHSNYHYNGLWGHMQYYDSAVSKWLPRTGRWGRQHRECNICRTVHNAHYMTWYKKMDTYGNGNRNRICFDCVPLYTTSYNTSEKCFVVTHEEISQQNIGAFAHMEDDYYVNYVHGDNVPTARGSRDYLLQIIDDPDYQDEVMFHDEQAWEESSSLPIDVRKYMTWMYRTFKHNTEDIKNQVVADIKEHLMLSDDTTTGVNNADNVAVPQSDEYPNGLTGAEYVRKVGLHLPSVYVYASENPISDIIISLRIDTQFEDREWYYRSNRANNDRRADDNWREPDNIGLELNVVRNDYRYAPDFYYVDYRDGEYFNYSVEAPHHNVPMGHRCSCTHCVDGNITHPDSPNWHEERGVHLGLELELVARDGRLLDNVNYGELFERTVQVFHPENLKDMVHRSGHNAQLLYAKRDGSLPNESGIEFISQPMTLKAWHAVPVKFWNFVESNYKAFNLDDVGIHIHFPWASMKLPHAYTMLSALNALQLNQNGLLGKIAQRNDSTYARWDLLQYRDTYNVVADVAKNRTRADNDKYKAINLQHENTVELRYFKSNARGSRVVKNLEFVDALYEMTKNDAESTSGWNHDEDMPQIDLIEVATQYGNQSTKFKIEGVHHEQVPFANDIEFRLYNFVLDRQNRYPNLYEFLYDDGEYTAPDIALEDIGYWNTPVTEELQDNTTEDDSVFRNTTFNFGSESITLNGTTYTNTMGR